MSDEMGRREMLRYLGAGALVPTATKAGAPAASAAPARAAALSIPFEEETIGFSVKGQQLKALLRSPQRRADTPALLVNLTGDRVESLDGNRWGYVFRVVPDIFLGAGHRVMSFDLPYHGERATRGGGLGAWAAAWARGEDVMGDVHQTLRALIDLLIQRKVATDGLIALNGISRGGLSCLHGMAADKRVLACAAHAPPVHLPAVEEFKHLAGNKLVEQSNPTTLIPKLADRPVFLAVGSADPRVGAEHTFAFHAHLNAACAVIRPQLFCGPGTSHGARYPDHAAQQAAGAFLLGWCAQKAKLL